MANKSLRKKMKQLQQREEQDVPNELFKAAAGRKSTTMKHRGERRAKDARNHWSKDQ